jgi:hypothetical protein
MNRCIQVTAWPPRCDWSRQQSSGSISSPS